MAKERRFPYAREVEIPPELEGWEEMYPPHRLFSEERREWEDKEFWYQDKIHAPEPMPPLDEIFHQAWQISLAQHTTRVFCIPPAQGICQRMLGCYMYICAIEPPPEAVIGEKAERFGQRVFPVFANYEKLWDEWLPRFQALGRELEAVKVPKELPRFTPDMDFGSHVPPVSAAQELMEAFNDVVNIMYRGWQYHFNYLNLSYLAYLMFVEAAQKVFPGISLSAIGKMVAGAEVSMFRPEEELCRLARLAHAESKVAEVLKSDRLGRVWSCRNNRLVTCGGGCTPEGTHGHQRECTRCGIWYVQGPFVGRRPGGIANHREPLRSIALVSQTRTTSQPAGTSYADRMSVTGERQKP